mgnify:CR=1 FL=1
MIHPSAFVSPQAKVHETAVIGPWCIVDSGAEIGESVVLESRVHVYGGVTIGKNTHVFDGAILGAPPQDLKYAGEPTRVSIGEGCTLREYVTVNRGTAQGGGCTPPGGSQGRCRAAATMKHPEKLKLSHLIHDGG